MHCVAPGQLPATRHAAIARGQPSQGAQPLHMPSAMTPLRWAQTLVLDSARAALCSQACQPEMQSDVQL